MKYRSAPGRYIPEPEEGHIVLDAFFKIPEEQREGIYGWGWQKNPNGKVVKMLYCYLPDKGRGFHGLPVVRSKQEAQELDIQTAYWIWDGNIEKPTLQPSILSHPPFDWHGYLVEGYWKACE